MRAVKHAAIVLVAFAGIAIAAPSTDQPIEDTANVLSASDETALVAELGKLRDEGVDMAIVLVRSTGAKSIESYAREIAENWSSGRKAAAVLVLAIGDRKSRLEVSDTLRSKFPDARAKSILDNSRGYLRRNDYAGAVRAVIDEVRAGAAGIAPDLESPHPQTETGSSTATTTTTESTTTTSTTSTETSSSSSSSSRYSGRTGYPWLLPVVVIALLLGIGAMWAAAQRKASGTFNHDGTVIQKPFVADWLWCTVKIVGFLLFVIGVILAASSKSSSSRSWTSSTSNWSSGSTSSSSTSSSTSSSSGGGGWSGGGASSSW